MSARTFLASRVAAYITGTERLERNRRGREARRRREGRGHEIDYFHSAADPYSHLVVQLLGAFGNRYDVSIRPRLVPPPPDWAAPERGMLEAYARRDAALLAGRAGLAFSDVGHQPDPARIVQAEDAFAEVLGSADFAARAVEIGQSLWTGAFLPEASGLSRPLLAEADAHRRRLGHYLGGMLHYEGEWYWGIDRFHYLEARLRRLGAYRGDPSEPFLFEPPAMVGPKTKSEDGHKRKIDFFLSFRSPYTYIAAARVRELAESHGAELRLRFVLPMMMRGLPVPRMKRFYITSDVAREARRYGIGFGRIADPLGTPVERGYAILPMAIEEGMGFEFSLSFMQGVWAEGIDAGSDNGLRRIVERAGLDWRRARSLIGGHHWQDEAEANRREMIGAGLWGVPCFRVDEVTVWGQDRLWAVEDTLNRPIARESAHAGNQ